MNMSKPDKKPAVKRKCDGRKSRLNKLPKRTAYINLEMTLKSQSQGQPAHCQWRLWPRP